MNDSVDLNDMMVFLAIVEAGSFTAAADRLDIPKANVSRKLARLEQQLKVVLLQRSTRTQKLTEAGKSYLAHCQRIQEEVALAKAAISELVSYPQGSLHIGTSVTIGQQILKPQLSQFLLQYPEIDLHLDLANRRVDLIEEGYDLLIRVGELEDSSLIGKKLGSVQQKIVASPAYIKKHGEIKSLNDICSCHCLVMSASKEAVKWHLQSGRKKTALAVQPHLRVDDFSILLQAVIDGVGIAVIPDYMCQQALESGQLINVLPEWGAKDVNIYALYPPDKMRIPKVKVFLDFVVGVFDQAMSR